MGGSRCPNHSYNGQTFQTPTLDSIRIFTKKVIQATNAEYVQIGNEINHGMMKPFGAKTVLVTFRFLQET